MIRIYLIVLFVTCLVLTTEAKPETGFTLTFSPIEDEDLLIGKWVFSEVWASHMGLALDLKSDHTFSYWFTSDVFLDEKYPIEGKWELVKGVLRLSATRGCLYSEDWVLTSFNGKKGLLSPENIKVLIWHEAKPDSRFIRKLDCDPDKWPIYNYPEE